MKLQKLACGFLIWVLFDRIKIHYFHSTLKDSVSHCVVSCLQDLTDLQKERQCLEKQHQQEINKLNHELQQARSLHNALQAQMDKVTTWGHRFFLTCKGCLQQLLEITAASAWEYVYLIIFSSLSYYSSWVLSPFAHLVFSWDLFYFYQKQRKTFFTFPPTLASLLTLFPLTVCFTTLLSCVSVFPTTRSPLRLLPLPSVSPSGKVEQ